MIVSARRAIMTTASRRFGSDQSPSCDSAGVRLDGFSYDVGDRAPPPLALVTQFRIEIIGKVDRYAPHGRSSRVVPRDGIGFERGSQFV
jgi:hypothetical protein